MAWIPCAQNRVSLVLNPQFLGWRLRWRPFKPHLMQSWVKVSHADCMQDQYITGLQDLSSDPKGALDVISCPLPLTWQSPMSYGKLQGYHTGYPWEKPELCSNCPLICKKHQAGRPGRKSYHCICISPPCRPQATWSRAVSSTYGVNRGHQAQTSFLGGL